MIDTETHPAQYRLVERYRHARDAWRAINVGGPIATMGESEYCHAFVAGWCRREPIQWVANGTNPPPPLDYDRAFAESA